MTVPLACARVILTRPQWIQIEDRPFPYTLFLTLTLYHKGIYSQRVCMLSEMQTHSSVCGPACHSYMHRDIPTVHCALFYTMRGWFRNSHDPWGKQTESLVTIQTLNTSHPLCLTYQPSGPGHLHGIDPESLGFYTYFIFLPFFHLYSSSGKYECELW